MPIEAPITTSMPSISEGALNARISRQQSRSRRWRGVHGKGAPQIRRRRSRYKVVAGHRPAQALGQAGDHPMGWPKESLTVFLEDPSIVANLGSMEVATIWSTADLKD
ncbi:hypothetical protein ACE10Z_33695 [Bradyrhizobium sp. Pha-3]|uniref:hypothetical protein n=1 Tax=Bradyrhizobium sp. Pha-3 TaxID=208375 RepID=UPI0035D41861